MVSFISIIGGLTISLIFLFVGLTVGFVTSRANKLAIFGVALFAGSLVWLGSLLFSSYLVSIPFFLDYVSMANSVIGSPFVFGSQLLTAVFTLIGLLEIGYIVGCASPSKSEQPVVNSLQGSGVTPYQRIGLSSVRTVGGTAVVEQVIGPSNPTDDQGRNLQNEGQEGFSPISTSAAQYIARSVNMRQLGPNLSEDERTLASLFVFNKVREVSPKLDDLSPDGYIYDQLRNLEWDTPRETQALNALTLRNYLVASPKEKTLKCKACGSMRLQVRSQCPECGSLGAERHKVLEHFPCGMIDREENFRGEKGDLICPKCNKALELIGLDYRSLGSMFVCQSCGALNKELTTSLKCSRCSNSAKPEEEVEVYLFSYALNPAMSLKLKQFVKPVQTIANYFDSCGYTVFTPAIVRGKSGTEHTFDLLVLERSALKHTAAFQAAVNSNSPKGEGKKLIVEILVSESPIKLEEVTTVYGKINDIAYQSTVVAIPSLAESARSYAKAYGLRVVEGPDTDSVISKLGTSINPLADQGTIRNTSLTSQRSTPE
ncbi:MAG TPA: hypothetical protein VFF30_17315 [Nitrososphaerales archaeon]|nr:hypothetical protein [Nitrososphaerales archaeon]